MLPEIKRPKEHDELLKRLNEEFEKKHKRSIELLSNIKSERERISRLLNRFKSQEPDQIYRFYHQSFKVFIMVPLIEQADKLFRDIAPEGSEINSWYGLIAKGGIGKAFDEQTTNENWLSEVPQILLAFWNAKYFLEQMTVAADELNEAPMTLPSGWAAVLYLYGLR